MSNRLPDIPPKRNCSGKTYLEEIDGARYLLCKVCSMRCYMSRVKPQNPKTTTKAPSLSERVAALEKKHGGEPDHE